MTNFEFKYRIVPTQIRVKMDNALGYGYLEKYNLVDDNGVKINKYPFLSRRSATRHMFQLEAMERKGAKGGTP